MARDYAKSRSKKKPSSPARRTSRLSSGMLWLFIGIMMGLLIPSFGYIKQHVISLVEGKKTKNSNESLLRDPIPQKVKTAQSDESEELEQHTTQNNNAETPVKKTNAEKPIEDNVDFDFYTILPDSEATKPPATKTLEKNLENAEQKLLAPPGTKSDQNPAQTTPAKPKKIQEEILLPTPQFKTSATSEAVPAPQPKTIVKPAPKPLVPAAKPANKPSSGYILQLGSFKTFEEADQLKAQLSLSGLQAKIKETTINGITRHRVWIGIYPSLEAAEKAQKQLAASNLKSALAQVK